MPHNDGKHRAKRWNGRVKLVATLFNSVAIVTLAAVVINPIANKHYDVFADSNWILLLGAVCSHMVALAVLTFIRAEE